MDVERSESRVVAALSQAGYRITRPRRAVIRALLAEDSSSRPEEIRARARQYCPSIGKVTVYRTLDLLSSLGFVRRIHSQEGCHGRATAGLGHRHHVVCRQCGSVAEFEGCDLSPFLERMCAETGYMIEEHLLELVGLCPECQ